MPLDRDIARRRVAALKKRTSRTIRRAGLDLRLRRSVPFGVRWEDDFAYCLQGRAPAVIVDVGAHEGETAQRMVSRFPSARVHCFEPMPESFRRLSRGVAGLDVVCVQAALGAEEGSATMGAGASSLTSGFLAAGPGIEVRVQTLDAYARDAGIASIALLKVDVEGHEPAVLRGAAGLLAAGRIDHVLCECEFVHRPDEPHGDFAEILGLLAPHGFRIVSFYTGGIDALGWRWGDVLLRRVDPAAEEPIACSPYDAIAAARTP
jgi:FkbM family methyltransferase